MIREKFKGKAGTYASRQLKSGEVAYYRSGKRVSPYVYSGAKADPNKQVLISSYASRVKPLEGGRDVRPGPVETLVRVELQGSRKAYYAGSDIADYDNRFLPGDRIPYAIAKQLQRNRILEREFAGFDRRLQSAKEFKNLSVSQKAAIFEDFKKNIRKAWLEGGRDAVSMVRFEMFGY